jgi:membrane associated rhomboid family serine protease
MGIYDRDYVRQPASRNVFTGMRVWSINTWLIAINIAVFILDNLVTSNASDSDYFRQTIHPIFLFGYFSVAKAVFSLQIWRFVTFQFLHANLQHVGYNMLALFFFGPMVEQYLGSRKYLAYYLLCGIAGPIMYIIMWILHILLYNGAVPLVGASAGIFGVLIFAAQVAPDTTVMFDFFIPIKLRTFVWIMLAIAAYSVLAPNQENAGGEAAHLGGAAAGWLLFKNQQLLNFADFRRGPRMRIRR